jgi:pentatricopeptide repeat protein
MAQALINAKKYLYAEGLLRRLIAIINSDLDSSTDGKGFEIQLHSLESYHSIMTKFNRNGEANEVRALIDRLKQRGFRRDIEFFAYFDQCEFKPLIPLSPFVTK